MTPILTAEDVTASPRAPFLISIARTKDPAREMIRLTTYLGHTKPENTYWYIEAVLELLELPVSRVRDVLGPYREHMLRARSGKGPGKTEQ